MDGHLERERIGEFSVVVVEALELGIEPGTPIYIGESNRKHMARRHRADFDKYGSRIGRIIAEPDYIGFRADDGTVEYVKAFGVCIKVAVRVSASGDYYVRSLYHISDNAFKRFVADGSWKRLKPAG